MNEEVSRISRLICNHIIGTITDEECEELKKWVNANDKNRETFARLIDNVFLEKEYRKVKAVNPERAMRDMQMRIKMSQSAEKRKNRRQTAIKHFARTAAAVALLIGGYIIYNNVHESSTTTPQVAQVETQNIITHGTTQAVMSFDNGEEIALGTDSKKNADLIAKAEKYEDVHDISLKTPRGGEFRITLEDGTEVWLNAESRLDYPETFGDKERRVAVTGEAYFKVAKDAERPFLVETDGQVVKVYGTEFNVHSYKEDAAVATTLVEGSIALQQVGGNGSELRLTPGHQAQFDKSSAATNVRTVDTSVVTSWRSGRFVFEEQNLEQIMQTLSRWYDFEYEFKDEHIAQTMFMGSVPRYGEFSEVLSILEKSGGLKFKQKDKTIVIFKNL